MSRSRPVLERGQWAEPGRTLAASIAALEAEARAYDIPTFNSLPITMAWVAYIAITIAVVVWAFWTGTPA